jgi:hypothetical protein
MTAFKQSGTLLYGKKVKKDKAFSVTGRGGT